jgi:hypothetical protein
MKRVENGRQNKTVQKKSEKAKDEREKKTV